MSAQDQLKLDVIGKVVTDVFDREFKRLLNKADVHEIFIGDKQDPKIIIADWIAHFFYKDKKLKNKVSMKYKKTKVTGLILFGLIGLVSVLDEQAINLLLLTNRSAVLANAWMVSDRTQGPRP